ncbi:MAG: poly-beta-1,6-N-acetyl-D-glucosamine biosynthesis protein PgaD [Wujia sp.]
MNEQLDSFTNPLPQKVDYDLEDHLIYDRQKGWKKVIEWILTITGWAVLLSYIIYLIYGTLAIHNGWYLPEFAIYTREMVLEIQRYFYILFIAFLIICVLLIFWKNYNLRRFGRLHRRRFRPPVTNDELADMFELDMQTIESLQNNRVTVLEHNIIPEGLGMGHNRDEKEEADTIK